MHNVAAVALRKSTYDIKHDILHLVLCIETLANPGTSRTTYIQCKLASEQNPDVRVH